MIIDGEFDLPSKLPKPLKVSNHEGSSSLREWLASALTYPPTESSTCPRAHIRPYSTNRTSIRECSKDRRP
jgi:hypothetical protein